MCSIDSKSPLIITLILSVVFIGCSSAPVSPDGERRDMVGYDDSVAWHSWTPADTTSWPDEFATATRPFDSLPLSLEVYDGYWELLFVLLDEQRVLGDISPDQVTSITAAMSVLEGGPVRQIDATFVTNGVRKTEGVLLRLGRQADGRIANISVYVEFGVANSNIWIWLDDGFRESKPLTFLWEANAEKTRVDDNYGFDPATPAGVGSVAFIALFEKIKREFTGQPYVEVAERMGTSEADLFLPGIWMPVTDRTIDVVFPNTKFPPRLTNFPIK